MLAIPLGLYHTGSEYPGRSPIVLVCVTPLFQWKCRYFSSGGSMIFERYFSVINALHINWLSRRRQFSSILASAAAARMLSPECIMMALPFLALLLICSVFGISFVEVWHKMRPGDGSSPHSLVGGTIMRLHESYFTFNNALWYPLPGVLLGDFS